MDKIREVFHKISNHLNNISIIAGLAKEEMKDSSSAEKEKVERDKHVCESLQKIEDNVGSLSKKIEELRTLISPVEGSQQ